MADGKKPEFAGVVQENGVDNKMQKVGRIALWYNTSMKDRAPLLQGEIKTEAGKKYRLALWKFKSKEGGL